VGLASWQPTGAGCNSCPISLHSYIYSWQGDSWYNQWKLPLWTIYEATSEFPSLAIIGASPFHWHSSEYPQSSLSHLVKFIHLLLTRWFLIRWMEVSSMDNIWRNLWISFSSCNGFSFSQPHLQTCSKLEFIAMSTTTVLVPELVSFRHPHKRKGIAYECKSFFDHYMSCIVSSPQWPQTPFL
jgi:hypothetical protein